MPVLNDMHTHMSTQNSQVNIFHSLFSVCHRHFWCRHITVMPRLPKQINFLRLFVYICWVIFLFSRSFWRAFVRAWNKIPHFLSHTHTLTHFDRLHTSLGCIHECPRRCVCFFTHRGNHFNLRATLREGNKIFIGIWYKCVLCCVTLECWRYSIYH